MTDISPTVLIDEWLPVSPPAANATAAASYANGSIQIVVSHPAALASGLSSSPAKAAGNGGSGATARKRRREALAGAGKQPKRARGKKEKTPLTESTAANGGEQKQADAFNASDSDPCDRPESAPESPTSPAFRRGGLAAQWKRGGISSSGGGEDARSPTAQTPVPTNLEASARANRGAKQKADVVVGQPLAKKLVRRCSLLPSPAPIFRQTLGELWSLLDPSSFSASEPASSLEQPTKPGPSQSFSLGQEATTSEPPTPSAQSCFQRCPADAAAAATDAEGANGAGSENGAGSDIGARSICAQTSGGSADAEEGSLDSVIGGGKRGPSKTASAAASARARSGGAAITARQVAVLREAVAAAHSAGRAVVSPAGSSPADAGASSGSQGGGDGGKRRARRPFSRQGSSNAPHVAVRDGKAAGARGALGEDANGAEVALGPSFESQLCGSPNWSGSPDLSLQAHSMQSLWPDEGSSDLPLVPLACAGEQGSGVSPNLLPNLDWQMPSGMESREQVEVDWARLPDLDELPNDSPRYPNLDASLAPRLPASLDGVSSLAYCGQGGLSEQWLPVQQQQPEPQGQEQQEQGMVVEDGDGDGRAEGTVEGGMEGNVEGRVAAEAHEAVASAVQRDAVGGGERWSAHEGGPLVEPTPPQGPPVTQPCLLIGQPQPLQAMSAGDAASVAPMDFEAAASVAGRAELWQAPHAMSEGGLEGMDGEEGGVWEELEVVMCGVKGGTGGGDDMEEGREGARREWDLASAVRECTAARLSPTPPTAAPPAAIAPPLPWAFTAPLASLPAAAASPSATPHHLGAATAPSPAAASVHADGIATATTVAAAAAPNATQAATTASLLPPAPAPAAEISPRPLTSSAPPLASPSIPLDSRQSSWAAACRTAHRRPTSSNATSCVSAGTAAAAATAADATAAGTIAAAAIPSHLPGRALSCSSLSLAHSRSRSPTLPPLDRTISNRAPAAALQMQSQGAAHTPHRGRGGSDGNGGPGVKEQEVVVQLLSRVATVDWEEVRRPMSRAAQSIQCDWARRRLSSVKRWGDVPVISLPDSSVSDGSLQEGASRVRGDGVGWGGGGGVGAALSGVSDVSAGAGSCVKGA
ncbi:unnamed protein product [Closterium sp. Yama58-4]|nr:unnamed protein product [Closterium sp. Yama58-4]